MCLDSSNRDNMKCSSHRSGSNYGSAAVILIAVLLKKDSGMPNEKFSVKRCKSCKEEK